MTLPSLNDPFFIVGIGASAGGLEAVGGFLKNLPADTGMAFVFVQHLAPTHTSLLSEILSKKTSMPVSEAVDGILVQPNRIYIIPPNTIMTIAQRQLHLKPRNDALGHPMPIDDFFHSLALDQGPNAIGISLSGSGTDGAIGIQSIKSEGGITFAQDTESAQYISMPQAATSLGYVDFVLSPPDIAQALVRINLHPLHGNAAPSPLETADDDAALERIFQLLHESCKLDFTHYKRGTIRRRLARRLALLNLYTVADYISFIEANPDEVKTLCQDFLIRVTSFFRDPDIFEAITAHIFSRTTDELPPLRIWVPGCSTGEEVYSLAICCIERLAERGISAQIQIFGTDVSEPALQFARTGLYVENIARNVSPQRLEKFFVKTGDHYQVSKSVRDLCVFARHDVTCDPPFSRLDLVSCRNLLIYLDPVLQKRVIPLFHYALKPGGTLVLGPAENIAGFTDIFAPDESKGAKFYTKKPLPRQSQLKYIESFPGKAVAAPPSPYQNTPHHFNFLKKQSADAEQQRREVDRITQNRYVPAAVLCNKSLNVLEFRGNTSPYLTQPSGPPETSLQKLAPPGLFIEINKAVHLAAKENTHIRKTDLKVETSVGNKNITLEVIPIQPETEEASFLIFFEDKEMITLSPHKKQSFWTILGAHLWQYNGRASQQRGDDDAVSQIKQELADTRDYIRIMNEEYEATKEELQASQEELLSSNEEFQSANEELETAKEELQSANEELLTTNEEVRHRNTELSELNDKLNGALNYAETIIKTVSQPFLVLDGYLHVLRANPAFYQTFKTTPKLTEGRLLYDLGDRQWDIAELRQFLQSVIQQDCPFKDYEITHTFPNVGKKTMRLNGTHLAWQGQSQILLAIEDVSGYKTALDTLKDNDRHKDEFLAMLAHELRNPLAPIRHGLEVLKIETADDEMKREASQIVERQLQKVVGLVDDLLDVARITRGLIALKKSPVDLVQLLCQTVEATRSHFSAHNHQLSVSLPKEKIFVKGDAIRLDQIFSNLLINAAKYTEFGGKISLNVEQENNQVVISVIDNGVGISAELLPYIFDLFVQAERSLDRKQGGLGIGLTLVRRLVELHAGTVEAKSTGPNKGSEFIVRLPILSADSPKSVPVSDTKQSAPFVARRILIIEDSPDAAKMIQMLLKVHGHQTQIADNGPSGIKAAQDFKPDVILLDIGLPGMDGYEVAQRLRRMPEMKNVLLIALSGYGQAEDFQRSKEAGVDHHLIKPPDTDQLYALIAGYKSA